MIVRARVMLLTLAAAISVAAAQAARAQDSGNGFLFHVPTGSWSLRGGFAMPNANSDIFTFSTSQLTLNHADFGSMEYGTDLGFALNPRLDLTFDLAISSMSKGSQFRDWVDNNNQPIEQTTSFQRIPFTVNLRYYLLPRGREIGHFTWVPSGVVPYVGAGAGLMYYTFEQKGDFIDDSTRAVFPDAFNSNGWAPTAQAFAGAEWSLGAKWALRTEVRYLTGSASLGSDFAGFHRIDLSGMTSSVGIFVRF